MKTFVWPAQPLDKTGLATEAKQDAEIAELQAFHADNTAENAAELAELQDFHSDNTTENQAIQNSVDTFSQKTGSGIVTVPFDYQSLSYIPSGNGAGKIGTVVFKTGGSGGTTVATLTLAYDVGNNLISVTRS